MVLDTHYNRHMNRPGTTMETGKERPGTVARKKNTWTDVKHNDHNSRPKKSRTEIKNARRHREPPKVPKNDVTINPNPNVTLIFEKSKRMGQPPWTVDTNKKHPSAANADQEIEDTHSDPETEHSSALTGIFMGMKHGEETTKVQLCTLEKLGEEANEELRRLKCMRSLANGTMNSMIKY